MHKEHHYRAVICWDGKAAGVTANYKAYSRNHLAALEGKPLLEMSADPAFRGDAARLNPEDCLLIALSSCHMLSYLAFAALEGLVVTDYRDEATGTMLQEGVGGRFVEVVLRPQVTVAAGSDAALAQQLHEKAGKACFIASSVNFPVRHESAIHTAQA
jgi:organic hydroperoxide reductase OsmC/OhrA